MALLTGMTADGLEVPVQVLPDGKLVAEGLEGKEGPAGAAAVIGGTASLPGLHLPADATTGLYSPSSKSLGFSTNGLQRLTIDGGGRVGIGAAPPKANTLIYINQDITGATEPYSVLLQSKILSDCTSAVGFATSISTEPKTFAISILRHFVAGQGAIGAGSNVYSQYGFWASSSLSAAANNYGFYGALDYAPGRWNFYAAGTADSRFASNNFIFANGGAEKARFDAAGRLLIGRDVALAGSAAKLQTASSLNLTVSIFDDNATAKAGGLVAGDVYRKADGTLMITY
jgi:hypothetical protein